MATATDPHVASVAASMLAWHGQESHNVGMSHLVESERELKTELADAKKELDEIKRYEVHRPYVLPHTLVYHHNVCNSIYRCTDCMNYMPPYCMWYDAIYAIYILHDTRA